MSFNPNIGKMYQDSELERSGGYEKKFPIVQWAYGNKTLASKGLTDIDSTGGFFISSDSIPDDLREKVEKSLLAAGWVAASLSTQEDGAIEGFSKGSIEISFLVQRKRFFHRDNGQDVYGSFDDIFGKYKTARTHLQALVALPELIDICPVMLTFKVTAAMCFEGTKDKAGIMDRFYETIIKKADEVVRKAMGVKGNKRMVPYREFWVGMGLNLDKAGKVVFEMVGTGDKASPLSLPAPIGLPDSFANTTEGDLNRLAISDDQRNAITAMHDKYAEEFKSEWEKYTRKGATEPAAATAKPVEDAFASATANGL